MLFKTKENVPGVYVEKSRDFQLLCHLLDIYLNYELEKALRVRYSVDIEKCDSSLLPLIAHRQGFITNKYIPDAILRNICRVFPYLIKNKGTIEAVRAAALAVLSSDQSVTILEVSSDITDLCRINIISNAWGKNKEYLEELLKFILPAGCLCSLNLNVSDQQVIKSKFNIAHTVKRLIINNTASSSIINSEVDSLPEPGSQKEMTYSKIGWVKIINKPVTETAKVEQSVIEE